MTNKYRNLLYKLKILNFTLTRNDYILTIVGIIVIKELKVGKEIVQKKNHHRTKHNMNLYSEADKMSLATILQTDINENRALIKK